MMKKKLYLGLALCALIPVNTAFAFTLSLDNGWFFGPGSAVYNDTGKVGVMKFVDAELRDVTFTGPLTGFVPFSNNGAAEPNVIAEKLTNTGIVDGLTSDGTLINENADTGLRLNFNDPITGESADMMAIAEADPHRPDGSEPIFTDEKGNLVFAPSIVADPGQADMIGRFAVFFTSGTAEVPLSAKTLAGEEGGQDNAGPLPSGRIVVGRIGDYDQDGYMDGELVMTANSPTNLIVARGNPISQRRPWTSDIPVDPALASGLTLNNIVQNYPEVIQKVLTQRDVLLAADYLGDIDTSMKSALSNIRRVLVSDQYPLEIKAVAKQARVKLQRARRNFQYATEKLESFAIASGQQREHVDYVRMFAIENLIKWAFKDTGKALMIMSPAQPPMTGDS